MTIENGSARIDEDEQGNEEKERREESEKEKSNTEICRALVNCSPAIERGGMEAEDGERAETIHGEEVRNINEHRRQEGIADVMTAAEIDDIVCFFA